MNHLFDTLVFAARKAEEHIPNALAFAAERTQEFAQGGLQQAVIAAGNAISNAGIPGAIASAADKTKEFAEGNLQHAMASGSGAVPVAGNLQHAMAAAGDAVSNSDIPGTFAKAAGKAQEFVSENVPQAATQAVEWAAANPGAAAAIGAAGAGLLLVVAPVVVIPTLGAVGFGADGNIAGSAAAGIHGDIGNVVAPSLFATLQSAGAGGYGVAAVQAIGGIIAASAGAAVLNILSEQEIPEGLDGKLD